MLKFMDYVYLPRYLESYAIPRESGCHMSEGMFPSVRSRMSHLAAVYIDKASSEA